jgi:hypothetical protein
MKPTTQSKNLTYKTHTTEEYNPKFLLYKNGFLMAAGERGFEMHSGVESI